MNEPTASSDPDGAIEEQGRPDDAARTGPADSGHSDADTQTERNIEDESPG